MNPIYQWQCSRCGVVYQTYQLLRTDIHNYICPTCFYEQGKTSTTAVYECAPVSKQLNQRRILHD